LDVTNSLENDAAASNIKFFYHLGDVVYDYGEEKEYPDQFYEVYKHYKVPIVAIPGNHDGSEYSGGPDSLVGFMNNFCDTKPQLPPSLRAIGMDFGRTTMTQPNCYWTFTTPWATIIGLYTNVPSGGVVRDPQIGWFNNEMRTADPKKKLVVAMHHPVFSLAPGSHKGSTSMHDLLWSACTQSKRVPDLVLAGHVHNYQRFTTTILDKQCTFVVAGCGGHAKDKLPQEITRATKLTGGETVNIATDKYVGFLRCTLTPAELRCELVAFVAFGRTTVIDSFVV
jgi:acid phosphatase type 7